MIEWQDIYPYCFFDPRQSCHPRQNFDLRYPRQNFMEPRHPRQNFKSQAIHVTHAKILWTHATHATLAKIWPTLPTNPRHPRDLADWFSHKDLIFLPLYFVLGQVLSISEYDLLNRRMSRKQNYCIMAVKIPSLILFRFCLFFWLKNHLFCVLSLL